MSSRKSLILVAAVLLLVPAATFASSMRVGIAGFGGYQTYSMGDVNDDIAATNTAITAAGGAGSLDDISHGMGFGGGIHAWTNNNWLISAEFMRLTAKSDASISDASSGAPVGTAQVKLPANAFTIGAGYFFPSTSKARFGLGAGVGYYKASGSVEFADPSITTTADASGHAVGFHGLGMVDYSASQAVHVEAGVGYRYAKTTNLEVGGAESLNADGSKEKVDWSGLMSRVGLTFYFGQQQHESTAH